MKIASNPKYLPDTGDMASDVGYISKLFSMAVRKMQSYLYTPYAPPKPVTSCTLSPVFTTLS